MNNYKLIIQYDGTNYAGWQLQKNAVTVQEKISEVINVIIKEKVNLIGSGRTDAGVHALGQVANFRTEKKIDINKFQYSLNAVLPKEISVNKIEKVSESFHARFDAINRSYLYIITHNKSPFLEKYSYFYPQIKKINFYELNRISKCLLGEHDFTSFSKKNEELKEKKCTITDIHWRTDKEKTMFYISANRFLHGMVRTITGTLLYAAEKKLDTDYIQNILQKKE